MSTILNDITTHYQAATLTWYSSLFPVANHLFAVLAVIEIAWSGLWWAVEKQDISSIWSEFLKQIVFLGFFYALLLHAHTWIPAIIKSFMLIGAGASHITKLDPSSIFSQGMSIASSVFVPLEKIHLFSALDAYIIAVVTALIVVISFAVIAGELVVTLIESYLVVGAGVLFLGLGSSRWTRSFTVRFLNYALHVGCKLLFLYLIVGVGANLALNWGQLLVAAGTQNMLPFLDVLGGALVFVFIAHHIPHKAAHLLSGSLHASFSGLTATSASVQQSATTTFSSVRQGVQTNMATLKQALTNNKVQPEKEIIPHAEEPCHVPTSDPLDQKMASQNKAP